MERFSLCTLYLILGDFFLNMENVFQVVDSAPEPVMWLPEGRSKSSPYALAYVPSAACSLHCLPPTYPLQRPGMGLSAPSPPGPHQQFIVHTAAGWDSRSYPFPAEIPSSGFLFLESLSQPHLRAFALAVLSAWNSLSLVSAELLVLYMSADRSVFSKRPPSPMSSVTHLSLSPLLFYLQQNPYLNYWSLPCPPPWHTYTYTYKHPKTGLCNTTATSHTWPWRT